MLIKVCGMTRADNIREIDNLGVDLIGFIFYPRSPRYLCEVPSYLPVRAQRVGVFVNEHKAVMLETARRFGLDYLQLHGDESPHLCRELTDEGFQVIKATTVANAARYSKDAVRYLLFDTPTPSYGGSGQSFDWKLLQHYTGDVPFLLSGGIGADSVEAIKTFAHARLAGIDLNSRFETEPGIKNIELLRTFIEQIR
ncbi:MAG: phosphoribosylanthranilate isomerase [Mediterranea sp.]|jgi:phosphoribosylanthranilate isomerase|nr:phosphoribosylanthranilate isomerase [Mediterranea sp.]